MSNTKEIELRIPAADGYGLEIGTATIEYCPIEQRLTACTVEVERRRGMGFEARTIDCLAGSDTLNFADKPLAALAEYLAIQWLERDEGRDWTSGFVLTRAERREMALEHAFDVAREMT